MSDVSLRLLAYFVAAADHGSMTAAALDLHLTQSGMSLAIAELERRLDAQLFLRRRGRGLTLTSAGRALLPDARRLLALADEVEARARDAGQGLAGRLTVGCSASAGPFLLPQLLATFAERCPDVEVDVLEGSTPELEQALLEGRCEIAIVYALEGADHVLREPLYTVAPHALLAVDDPLARAWPDAIPLEALVDEPLVLLDVPPSLPYVQQIFAPVGRGPRIRHRSTNFELVRSLVARGQGYAVLLNQPGIDVSYEGLKLVRRGLRPEPPAIDVALLTPRGAVQTRRCRVFAEHCRRVLPASRRRDPAAAPVRS